MIDLVKVFDILANKALVTNLGLDFIRRDCILGLTILIIKSDALSLACSYMTFFIWKPAASDNETATLGESAAVTESVSKFVKL